MLKSGVCASVQEKSKIHNCYTANCLFKGSNCVVEATSVSHCPSFLKLSLTIISMEVPVMAVE